ncbi:hypothetical protein [Ellagibacter isourolithinifaciens]|uniref:hypothetical protein n=1 Tax=Ellagibacter isourolithinifaciens TaxID=2137581 RepID=UPI003AF05714
MRVTHDLDGTYVLSCTDVELGLIAEGLYAVEDTGRRCLEAKVPDEVDTAALRDELYLLGDMRAQIDAALD